METPERHPAPAIIPARPACHPYADADWKPVPGWPHFADDHGRVCTAKGRVLTQRPNNSGYMLVDLWDPARRVKKTVTVQWCVLAAHAGQRPDGQEARHGPGGPADNHLANLKGWGTKADNHADKQDPDSPPAPVHPCRNAGEGCTGKAHKPGRRCLECVAEVGRQAADLLREGHALHDVAGRFGYTSPDWTYSLAVKYGHYTGTRAEARTQSPPLRGWRGWVARKVGAP